MTIRLRKKEQQETAEMVAEQSRQMLALVREQQQDAINLYGAESVSALNGIDAMTILLILYTLVILWLNLSMNGHWENKWLWYEQDEQLGGVEAGEGEELAETDVLEQSSSSLVLPPVLPPPHPPNCRRRDLFQDPSIFAELDEYVDQVSIQINVDFH